MGKNRPGTRSFKIAAYIFVRSLANAVINYFNQEIKSCQCLE